MSRTWRLPVGRLPRTGEPMLLEAAGTTLARCRAWQAYTVASDVNHSNALVQRSRAQTATQPRALRRRSDPDGPRRPRTVARTGGQRCRATTSTGQTSPRTDGHDPADRVLAQQRGGHRFIGRLGDRA